MQGNSLIDIIPTYDFSPTILCENVPFILNPEKAKQTTECQIENRPMGDCSNFLVNPGERE